MNPPNFVNWISIIYESHFGIVWIVSDQFKLCRQHLGKTLPQKYSKSNFVVPGNIQESSVSYQEHRIGKGKPLIPVTNAQALQREAQIKRWFRAQKEALIFRRPILFTKSIKIKIEWNVLRQESEGEVTQGSELIILWMSRSTSRSAPVPSLQFDRQALVETQNLLVPSLPPLTQEIRSLPCF